MKSQKLLIPALCLLGAILLSIPFLVPHTGAVSLFALVPLLMAERIFHLEGKKGFWKFHYPTFVLWNALTTFWVCNATVGGGIFAVLANSLQMSIVFGLFRLSKKTFKGALPYIFLASTWIAWEKAYFSAQISWPWLTLGNSFARTLSLCQWYEYLGSLGGSLWIWGCNLALFGILCCLSDGTFFRWNIKARIGASLSYAAVLLGPMIWSEIIWKNYDEKENPLEVLIVQPNFDPYQKFQHLSQSEQNSIFEDLLTKAMKDRKVSLSDTLTYSSMLATPLLAIGPETFTSDVFLSGPAQSETMRRFISTLRSYPGVNLLIGATTRDIIESPTRPSETVRPYGEGFWLQTRNSAVMTDASSRTEIFHKSKLVVGVEMTPYPKLFRPIDDKLGGVMGRDIGQEEISLLNVASYSLGNTSTGSVVRKKEEIPIGCAICYESVYGDYYRGYIQKGAQAMTVITNDAWWGDTPGYRQHLSYSSLRAIETRRDIARCANTGISAIINQRGEILESTPWWESAVLRSKINLNDSVTFFVKNGDLPGRVCTLVFILLLAGMVVRLLSPTARKGN